MTTKSPPRAAAGKPAAERKKMTIKELRRLSGLTQAALAKKIGCPKRTVEGWEYRNDPPEYVVKLIEYYLRKEKVIQ